jgi:hypothetical protein
MQTGIRTPSSRRPNRLQLYAIVLTCALHLALGVSFKVGDKMPHGAASPSTQKSNVFTIELKADSSKTPQSAAAPDAVSQSLTNSTMDLSESKLVVDAPGIMLAGNLANNLPVPDSDVGPVFWSTGQYYFSANELSERPHVLQDVVPLLSLSIPGIETQSVILRLLINEQGTVDSVHLDHTELPDDIVRVVIAAFSNLKFEPGKIDHAAVKSQLRIEVLLENTQPVLLKQNVN